VQPATQLLIGAAPAGGADLPGGDAVLASDGSELFLIWGGHRLAVPPTSKTVVLRSLGWSDVDPLAVTSALVAALPAGADLAPPAVPGEGSQTSFQIAGKTARAGQLLRDSTSGVTYVVVADGVVALSDFTARLAQAAGQQPQDTTSAQLAGVPRGSAWQQPAGLPEQIPTLIGPTGAAMACATFRGNPDPTQAITVQTYQQVPAGLPAVPPPAAGSPLADHVGVPGGRGALVSVQLPPGIDAHGTVYLVSDEGIKYALGGPDPTVQGDDPDTVKKALGYDGVAPVAVPDLFLDLIPTGSPLSPAAARSNATGK
jgi:hypothetical protein